MVVRYFLLVYDRVAGILREQLEFGPEERDAAYAKLDRLELAKPDHIEVVVIEGPSLEAIQRSHGRYFYSLEELAGGAGL